MSDDDRITPAWAAPDRVRAFSSTRNGGVSQGAWRSFNLGAGCGDDPAAVAENRRHLSLGLPSEPRWLQQVHGKRLVHLDDWLPGIEADAAWTDRPGQVCAILSADCLPVLLADKHGRWVAAIHAGWRGLADGILEHVVHAMPAEARDLLAWIGPAIGPESYEVDATVRDAMLQLGDSLADCFQPTRCGHWLADLKTIAMRRLRDAGVVDVVDAKLCTAANPQRFFSHRRDQGRSGRQVSLIWIDPVAGT